jgi:hypothetical protein
MVFDEDTRKVVIDSVVIDGPNGVAVAEWADRFSGPAPKVYIEQYRPRQKFSTDARMLAAEREIRQAFMRAKTLSNTGIQRVVTQEMMQMLNVYTFRTVSHHQDLRSAARIALLGMLKETSTNKLLADVIRDHLDGDSWTIHH